MSVFLNSVATCTPPHELPQDLVERNARRILGPRFAQFERMSASFKTSGVEKRYSFAPIEWFDDPKDWSDRNSLYLEEGKALFSKTANEALAKAEKLANEIDIVVSVSSTGIATPTFEALSAAELGFRSDIQRVPIFGLGCAGGVTGLRIAQQLAIADPGANVLLVVMEACTLSFRSDRLSKADIVATILFGDGAAAAVLSSDPGSDKEIRLGTGSEHMWPDTLNIMGWNVDETGLGVIFDRSIPAFALEHMKDAADTALAKAEIGQNDLARFVFHPGGTKVVEALEETLQLQTGTLDAERKVLRDYGNMSAPTALFVLDEVVSQGKTGPMMLGALGPGFTASFVPMDIAA
ncbi:MAG: type III polyketide synthase [Rhizobiaceae bacterium]|nr:type III polyketide synthase [Rhizobiaceae bacterium]